MTGQLILIVLVDNTTRLDRDFMGEAGLSFFIETGGRKVLFDTGLSGLFAANAGKMGIGLQDLDYLVFSHGHIDHTGGIPALVRYLAAVKAITPEFQIPELIAHSRCFWHKEMSPRKKTGSPLREDEIKQHFAVTLSDKPVWITDDLVFLGEIPRTFTFELTDTKKRRVRYPDGSTGPDSLLDDSALAYRSRKGLVIITGCSHAGICNITEYAREVCGDTRVSDIIGGLHLLSPGAERMKKTGRYLAGLSLGALHACHCTSLKAKIALADYCPVREVYVGLKCEW
jgi:7,8-dihydropterin-6-yl-methyl-4-(beta-D-ribofuranosyl)aminobenzene 5'-phosphate synthase